MLTGITQVLSGGGPPCTLLQMHSGREEYATSSPVIQNGKMDNCLNHQVFDLRENTRCLCRGDIAPAL